MIGVDTNVLVRFLVQDDPDQARRATQFMATLTPDRPGYLPTVVLVEAYWVLTRAYKVPSGEVHTTLGDLIDADNLLIQDAELVARALTLTSSGAHFPDALIAASCRAAGCESVVSFDEVAGQTLGFVKP